MSDAEFRHHEKYATVASAEHLPPLLAEARRVREAENVLASRLSTECSAWDTREAEFLAIKQGLEADLARLREQIAMMEEQREEIVQIAADAYRAVWREGWEPGKTKNEAFERLHSWLCDEGCDPNDEVGR
jgi:flagellar biosynthesis/type III secretory pathway protein FliH